MIKEFYLHIIEKHSLTKKGFLAFDEYLEVHSEIQE